MASCWRGMGVLLGTCVPSRPTNPHPTHTHTPTPRVSHPSSATPPSTASATTRNHSGSSPGRSRHHHHHHHHHHQQQQQQQQQQPHPATEGGPGARYLLVRPATATPPSPRRRHHSRPHVAAVGGGHAGSGRGDGRSGRAADVEGTPPLLLLSQALHLPPPPPHLASLIYTYGFKCPICSKLVLPDDLECHLVICLTKPRISYNEDVLSEDKGECVICLEELSQGDTIARLPCLCIYHKSCIDEWFQVNRSCPEHPYD